MKTLIVTDPQMCSECEDCINVCKKTYGTARTRRTKSIPIFCLHCHPDKAPCHMICPNNAIEAIDGENCEILKVNGEMCILCKLCIMACPAGAIIYDKEKNSVEKCTLCLDSDNIIPACVEACKDNVLNVLSIEDLQELKNDEDLVEAFQKIIKTFRFDSEGY
ncbi:MAG: 4Fe-4S binding protein [Methanobrevibacter sp.]|nr:4Fe-4S binding protein [Methanobrevibacter sp.]